MSSDAFTLLSGLFKAVWQLWTGWYIPGTNVTPAGFSLGILFVWLVLRHLGRIFGVSAAVGDSVHEIRDEFR